MKTSLLILAAVATARAFYAMRVYAPEYPEIHNGSVNARARKFIIGAARPSTYCGTTDSRQCPPGTTTLIDKDMTLLAASVPGGQFIFVSPLGSISYPSAHSSLRPPGSKIGGFHQSTIRSHVGEIITVLFWEPDDGYAGLWACPTSPNGTVAEEAELKATTWRFFGEGCTPVAAVQIRDAGDDFAAWAYT
ncbi:hypothetical protein B0T10DRAFT_550063 [Thelonectria olida]|uniref:Uncharacterized protein n=1 Tax=Thelonectria olida TaxID=1576542 RepID=A0A9P8W161_9HYPO|nr:hypothetical protein B0T10DRAFT_550063 [Thelonectria olida]